MLKNILWDVDGTLFDTYPAITYAISKSLVEMGLPVALNVIDGLARQSLSNCLETLSQRFRLDPSLLRQRFAESYRTLSPANQLAFPGVGEVCEFIHTQGGKNVAVTHRSVQSTQALLDAHGLAPYFSDVLSTEQGYPHKPDPTIVLLALEKHGLKSTETLLVGDRDLDIQAGRAAGIRTCLFGREDSTTPVDFQIERFSELLSLLKEANQ